MSEFAAVSIGPNNSIIIRSPIGDGCLKIVPYEAGFVRIWFTGDDGTCSLMPFTVPLDHVAIASSVCMKLYEVKEDARKFPFTVDAQRKMQELAETCSPAKSMLVMTNAIGRASAAGRTQVGADDLRNAFEEIDVHDPANRGGGETSPDHSSV